MDPEVLERLKRLQMADLGSRRRDHISTVEGRRPGPAAHLQDIEANRWANQQGSAAQRLAAKNEAKLENWNNVHQTIGDTQDLENLDTLNSGQTHRANLTAALHDLGGNDTVRNRPGGKKKTHDPSFRPARAPGSILNTGTKRKSGELPDDQQHRPRPPAPVRTPNSGVSKRGSAKGNRAVPTATRPRRLILASPHSAISAPDIAPTLPPTPIPAAPAPTTPVALNSPSPGPTAKTKTAFAEIKTGILLDFDAPLEEVLPPKAYGIEELIGLRFQEPKPEPPKRPPRQVYTIEELKRLRRETEIPKLKIQTSVTQKPEVTAKELSKTKTTHSVPSEDTPMPKTPKPKVSGAEMAGPHLAKSDTRMPNVPKANTPVRDPPQRDASKLSTPKTPRPKPDAPAWEPPKPEASKLKPATSVSGNYPPPEGRRTLSLIGNHLLPGRGGKKPSGLESSIYAS